MLFKMEIIEAEPGEEITYLNPYPRGEQVLISSTPAGTGSDQTAFILEHAESITFMAAPGFVFYGRTRVKK